MQQPGSRVQVAGASIGCDPYQEICMLGGATVGAAALSTSAMFLSH